MSLQAKIAALPRWRSRSDEYAEAALARLALAREWIASQPHAMECPYRPVFVGGNRVQWVETCTCGRDALLEALEVKP